MPRGVIARKNAKSIYIEFSYRGKRCREHFNMAPTKANLQWASNKRDSILAKIRDKTFNYADEFPESKNARLFGHIRTDMTIKEMLEDFLETAQKTFQPSTYRGYDIVCRAQLVPNFGNIKVMDLTTKHIRDFIKNSNCTKKYMNNVLIPLRHILDEAVMDKIIPESPLKPIVLAKLMDKDKIKKANKIDDINPYNEEERKKLIATAEGQMRNFFVTAIYSGLRDPSEMIGLQWAHIDFEKGIIKVRQAKVLSKVKATKTKAGVRDVIMLPQVRNVLQDQKQYTYLTGKYVFHHPATNKPWESYSLVRCWKTLHRKADVKFRPPKQTRHTYASMMCMANENLWWLAKQMGHEDPSMILRNYARFISDPNQVQGYQMKKDWTASF